MTTYVAVGAFVLYTQWMTMVAAAPPFTVTIDCPAMQDKAPHLGSRLRAPPPGISLCDCIQKAFPKGVKDGKFILNDVVGAADTRTPVVVGTKGMKPLKASKTLLGSPQPAGPADDPETDRLAKFQQGLERMLKFTTIMGHVDKYVSSRARDVVDGLHKVVNGQLLSGGIVGRSVCDN